MNSLAFTPLAMKAHLMGVLRGYRNIYISQRLEKLF